MTARATAHEPQIRVRRATASDAPAIRRIAHEAWRATYRSLLRDETIEWFLERAYAEDRVDLRIERHETWMGEVDGEAALFAETAIEPDRVTLVAIYADPGAARAGPRQRRAGRDHRCSPGPADRRGRAHRQRGGRDVLRGTRLRAPRADRRAARHGARPRASLVAGHAARRWRIVTDDVLSRLVIEGYLLQLGGWAGRHNYWAWTVFQELIDHKPEVAWPMLLELIRLAPDEHLDGIAAGPLEDFIARHGQRVIDVLEAEAAQNPRLRRTLAGVWQNVTPGFRLGPRRGPRRPKRTLDPERARSAAERDRGGYRVAAASSCWQH